jgi:S1-C subfamily serine protease
MRARRILEIRGILGRPIVTRLLRAFVCSFVLIHLGPVPAHAAIGYMTLADFPVPGGHFYSQASGQGINGGFAVVDDGSGPLFSEFERLGSVDKLGFPASQRFAFGGFLTQATQKELLQWRPDTGRVAFVNIFDILSDRGLDPLLAQTRLIPPTGDNSVDGRLTWNQVVSRHLALLDQSPAIRARFFGDASPLDNFGLPQSVADYGDVQVVRCERATFQLWRIATPFARPGDVTQVNAGDLAKEYGVVPPTAATPVAVSTQIVAPPGRMISPDPATVTAAWQSAQAARRALARIDVTFDGGIGVASGIVVDRNGDVLTNQHVVDGATTLKVTLNNGVSLPARVVGEDAANDLAIVQVPAGSMGADVAPAAMVGGSKLSPGQFVVALGYSPYFASPPAVRLGIYQQTLDGTIAVIRTDSFILPGDSGGMLLDLQGNIVGVNDEIRVTRDSGQPIIGFSIDSAQASRLGLRMLGGSTA